jgi:hypothetical protein
MSRCPRCENELPEWAKFCNRCGLSQTNPLLEAIPRVQKGRQIGNLGTIRIPATPHIFQDDDALSTIDEIPVTPPLSQNDQVQISVTPRIPQDVDILPTIKMAATRPAKANQAQKNGHSAAPYMRVPSLKARFTQNMGPNYIGRVVSVGRKPSRRNPLLTRAGLYTMLAILTCFIMGIAFSIVYVISHRTH